jgi:hypothetical protein
MGALNERGDAAYIRSEPCPECDICGASGNLLYDGLNDQLFGAPGKWNLKRCSNADCGLLRLDPMPLQSDIGLAYNSYYTHDAPDNGSTLTSFQPLHRAWDFMSNII